MKIRGDMVMAAVIAFVGGTGFGFVLGIFFFPFLFPQSMEMEDSMSSTYGEGQPLHTEMMEESPAPSQSSDAQSPAPVMSVEPMEVAQGTFVHVNTRDPVHWGKGGVSVYEDKVVMATDFEVGPGPKYHVYLSKAEQIEGASDVEDNPFVDLGRLRRFKGMQSYQIPSSVSLREQGYRHVVIWCEAFGVLISPASLRFDDGV